MRASFFIAIVILFTAFFSGASNAATFDISVDGTFFDFGYMELGEFKELKEKGEYHNEVSCTSDKGNIWYLKIGLVSPLRSGINEIPAENLKWKVVEITNGTGYALNRNEFVSFQAAPRVVYTSSPDDNAGRQVKIRFSYGLTVPQTQLTGNYEAVVRYTMAETL